MSEKRFDRIEERLHRLDGRIDTLENRVGDLDRHMHVLHEDVIERIAAIPEYAGPTRAEMNHGFAELRELIGRRLDPLEATVRQHTAEIGQLKRPRR